MISRRKVNQLLFLSIIILAVVAGWAVSELFKENTSEVSNDIDLKFTAVDHFGVDVSERTYSGYSKVFFFGLGQVDIIGVAIKKFWFKEFNF